MFGQKKAFRLRAYNLYTDVMEYAARNIIPIRRVHASKVAYRKAVFLILSMVFA